MNTTVILLIVALGISMTLNAVLMKCKEEFFRTLFKDYPLFYNVYIIKEKEEKKREKNED